MSILRTYLMDDPLRYYMILIIRYYMILIMDVEYLCGIDLSRPQFKYLPISPDHWLSIK